MPRNALFHRCDQCTHSWPLREVSQIRLITPFSLQHTVLCSQATYSTSHVLSCLPFLPQTFEYLGDKELIFLSIVALGENWNSSISICRISWCDILIGHMLKLLSWFSPWTFLLPLSSPSQKRALHLPYFELSSSLAWWQQEPPVGLPTSKPVQGELCLLSFPLSFSFSFSMWICFILVYLQPGFPFSFSSDYVLTSIAV